MYNNDNDNDNVRRKSEGPEGSFKNDKSREFWKEIQLAGQLVVLRTAIRNAKIHAEDIQRQGRSSAQLDYLGKFLPSKYLAVWGKLRKREGIDTQAYRELLRNECTLSDVLYRAYLPLLHGYATTHRTCFPLTAKWIRSLTDRILSHCTVPTPLCQIDQIPHKLWKLLKRGARDASAMDKHCMVRFYQLELGVEIPEDVKQHTFYGLEAWWEEEHAVWREFRRQVYEHAECEYMQFSCNCFKMKK